MLDPSLGIAWLLLPILIVLVLLLILVFVRAQRLGVLGESLSLSESSLANEEPGAKREVRIFTLVRKDGIRSIDEPVLLTPAQAAGQIDDADRIIGLAQGGESRAYPITLLSQHEIVNDVVGGRPVAVTYCPLCVTGIVYDRRVDGRTLEFGVSGKLVLNDLVMYDRQTESLWQQILGESIRGELDGARLTALPASQTTWSQWLASNPETLVLDWGHASRRDPYARYYESDDRGVIAVQGGDRRLRDKERVLGLVVAGQPKAYAFASLAAHPVVNDEVAGRSVAVVYDGKNGSAVVFERQVEERTLTFGSLRPVQGDLQIEDAETGTIWSGLTGRGLSGPLAGVELRQLPATPAFWFAWSDVYLRTDLYQPEE